MVAKEVLEQAKLEIADLRAKSTILEAENAKLQDKLTIANESRQQIEKKLADTDKLLEQHQVKEEDLVKQGRAAYESEMAKKEIQFLQARQDYEMEKNNMMKSHSTKVDKFRMQLDKIQTDKTHLEKLLQSEIDSHSRTQEKFDQLTVEAAAVAEELKIKSDEISCLRMSLEEVTIVAFSWMHLTNEVKVSKKLKQYEEGRPNVFLSVPSIFSIPKPPPIDVIEQSNSANNQSSNDTNARTRLFSHFEMEKSDSTQSSVDAFNDIVQSAVQAGASKCAEGSTESNETPMALPHDITDSQPDGIKSAMNPDVHNMQEQSDAVIAETAEFKSKPEKEPTKSRKRKATSSSNTSRQRNIPSAVTGAVDVPCIDQMAVTTNTFTTVTTRSRTNTRS
ncbi:hypothetical protein V1525DRAFT_192584 [Lipomyces kononenkoae]|uniref:Uncharacterized protein n=1 Tax=Lipomyces kononenkoae TaxID=34357 RepID=A0ACC3T1C5_LIPKO